MKWIIEIEAPNEDIAGKHLKTVANAFEIAATHKLPLDSMVLDNKDVKVVLTKKT